MSWFGGDKKNVADWHDEDMEKCVVAYLNAMEAVAVPRKLMAAIAEGHEVFSAYDNYICVDNPNFKPDDGSDVNRVFTLGDGPLSGLKP